METRFDFLGDYSSFLKNIFQQLKEKQVDVEFFHIDHLFYQTQNESQFSSLKSKLAELGQLVAEKNIHGRAIAVFGLKSSLAWEGWQIRLIELSAPKPGANEAAGLRRVAFTINVPFGELLRMNPNAGFDTSRKADPFNPEIRLNLGAGTASFRYFSIESVIDFEQALPPPMSEEAEAGLTDKPERSLADWERILKVKDANPSS